MKDTKFYTVGFPILFFMGGLLFFNQGVPQDSMGVPIPSPPTVEEKVDPHTEDTSSNQTMSQLNEEDFSIEVTQIEEDLQLHFLIHNNSKEELVYGEHYSLSKLEDETWIPVELDMAFIEIAYILSAESTVEETIYLDYLENEMTSGTYRLEKALGGFEYYDTFMID